MFNLFKRKKEQPQELVVELKPWEGEQDQLIDWLRRGEITEDELTEYIRTIEKAEPTIHDYTSPHWGHAYGHSRTYGKLIQFGHIFYGTTLMSSKTFELGDFVRLTTSKGTAHYMLLCIENVRDPRDMYWIHMVGMDLDESKEAQND